MDVVSRFRCDRGGQAQHLVLLKTCKMYDGMVQTTAKISVPIDHLCPKTWENTPQVQKYWSYLLNFIYSKYLHIITLHMIWTIVHQPQLFSVKIPALIILLKGSDHTFSSAGILKVTHSQVKALAV